MHKKLLTGLIICLVLSCTTKESKESDLTEKLIPNDTLIINGKSVIFFSVSQPEYDELVKDTNSDIDEVLSDFNYYADLVSDTIKKQGFKPVITASRHIKIVMDNKDTKTFDRLKDRENVTGYILTDGQKKPIIILGGGTDIDFMHNFDKFVNKQPSAD